MTAQVLPGFIEISYYLPGGVQTVSVILICRADFSLKKNLNFDKYGAGAAQVAGSRFVTFRLCKVRVFNLVPPW